MIGLMPSEEQDSEHVHRSIGIQVWARWEKVLWGILKVSTLPFSEKLSQTIKNECFKCSQPDGFFVWPFSLLLFFFRKSDKIISFFQVSGGNPCYCAFISSNHLSYRAGSWNDEDRRENWYRQMGKQDSHVEGWQGAYEIGNRRCY